MKNVVRLLPLALAAFASVATSKMVEDELSVYDATPGDGAVVADRYPHLAVSVSHLVDDVLVAPDPSWLSLRTRAGFPVAGNVEVENDTDLIFTPDAPLPNGDYVLVVTRQPGMLLDTDAAVLLDPESPESSDIGVRFTVFLPPTELTTVEFEPGARSAILGFSGPVELLSLLERIHFFDAEGGTVALEGGGQLESDRFEIFIEAGAVGFTIDAGVVDPDGQELVGLPVTF